MVTVLQILGLKGWGYMLDVSTLIIGFCAGYFIASILLVFAVLPGKKK